MLYFYYDLWQVLLCKNTILYPHVLLSITLGKYKFSFFFKDRKWKLTQPKCIEINSVPYLLYIFINMIRFKPKITYLYIGFLFTKILIYFILTVTYIYIRNKQKIDKLDNIISYFHSDTFQHLNCLIENKNIFLELIDPYADFCHSKVDPGFYFHTLTRLPLVNSQKITNIKVICFIRISPCTVRLINTGDSRESLCIDLSIRSLGSSHWYKVNIPQIVSPGGHL